MKSSPSHSKLLLTLFFVSGFCGLLYQIVWIRLAYASFGITTPVLSVVLSVFMAGLALGSWLGGRFVSGNPKVSAQDFLRFYALSEGLIGLGALAVPLLFSWGENLLFPLGASDSGSYLLFSAVSIFLALLPWCFFMGTTFPFMMAFIQKTSHSEESFSFLYTANVLGAMAGTLATLLLVELFGFHGTLWIGAGLNTAIALAALALAGGKLSKTTPARPQPKPSSKQGSTEPTAAFLLILFSTGFISMAMEVIWTRDFTVILKTQVYSFASLLFVYLLSTFGGSWLYRRHCVKKTVLTLSILLGLCFFTALLTVVLDDLRIQGTIQGVLLSIVPFCVALGYMTPRLVDRFSLGDPEKASRAYAVNVLGCILGPLAASYFFLPILGTKLSLVLISIPFLFFWIQSLAATHWKALSSLPLGGLGLALLGVSLFWSRDYEEVFGYLFPSYVVRRDYAATVISCGSGMDKNLYVNGIGMTALVEPTKVMAHLPLAFLSTKPQSVLDICFGMGTTFRALSRWNIKVTAVDLIPSVPRAFGYYFDDAPQVLANPNCHIVIDDGGRFLHRTKEKYDVITIDPPPPLEAAGSSLLYSTEFYDLAKSRLHPGGIVQLWVPRCEYSTLQAIGRSLSLSFPYVRVFPSPDGGGHHFLASVSPIPEFSVDQLLKNMPQPAQQDLAEWFPTATARDLLNRLLSFEVPLSSLLNPDPHLVITNDHPYNEYYLLRRFKEK